jgi:hypothetical protein
VNSYTILRRLIYDKRLQVSEVDTDNRRNVYAGMAAAHFVPAEIEVMKGLIKDGQVEPVGGRYAVTTRGEDVWTEARSNPTLPESKNFVWEALTGCTSGGKQSRLKHACLPTGKRHRGQSQEARVDMSRWMHKLARLHGLHDEECAEMIANGELRECNACGKWMKHYKSKHRSTGRQAYCRICMGRTKEGKT